MMKEADFGHWRDERPNIVADLSIPGKIDPSRHARRPARTGLGRASAMMLNSAFPGARSKKYVF